MSLLKMLWVKNTLQVAEEKCLPSSSASPSCWPLWYSLPSPWTWNWKPLERGSRLWSSSTTGMICSSVGSLSKTYPWQWINRVVFLFIITELKGSCWIIVWILFSNNNKSINILLCFVLYCIYNLHFLISTQTKVKKIVVFRNTFSFVWSYKVKR